MIDLLMLRELKGSSLHVCLQQELAGTIPVEVLGGLNDVRVLSLQNNFLTGSIPSLLGQLDHLEMISLNDNVSN